MIVHKLYLLFETKSFLDEIGVVFERVDRPTLRNTCLLVTNEKEGITLERSHGRHVVKDATTDQYVALPDHMVLASVRTIRVYAIKGAWRLDDTIQSKIIAMAFAMAAEIERDLISSRTTEALRARKTAGLPMGRPKGPGKSKLDPYRPEIEALLANGSTQKFIAKRYQTTPANLSNWIKRTGIKKPPI